MGHYVTTKEAKPKVHLCQHRIAELARQGRIKAHKSGKKWLVEVEPKDGIYELVYISGAAVVSAPTEVNRVRASIMALRQGLAELQAYSILRGDFVELEDTPPPEI